MHVPFDQLPAHSRVWIYQASRTLTEAECTEISTLLEAFLAGWQAHGTDLKAAYRIAYQRFIILAADQEVHAPTGCSIDSSVALMRQIEQKLDIGLFERTQIPFKSAEGTIETVPMQRLKEKIATGEVTLESTTFNNLVENIAQLTTEWEVPARNSWVKRYFGVTA